VKSSTENFSSALRFRTRKGILSSIEIITATRVVQTSDPERQLAGRVARDRDRRIVPLYIRSCPGRSRILLKHRPSARGSAPPTSIPVVSSGAFATAGVILAGTMSAPGFEFPAWSFRVGVERLASRAGGLRAARQQAFWVSVPGRPPGGVTKSGCSYGATYRSSIYTRHKALVAKPWFAHSRRLIYTSSCPKTTEQPRSSVVSCPSAHFSLTGVIARRRTDFVLV
jgi:hypothetical protein